jgi:diguanylate cyclase (GGDEF)-like protein
VSRKWSQLLLPQMGLATWIVMLGALAALPLCIFLYASYRVDVAQLRADSAASEQALAESAARGLRTRLQAVASQLRLADRIAAFDTLAPALVPGELDAALIGVTVHPTGTAGVQDAPLALTAAPAALVLSAFRVEQAQVVTSLTLRRAVQPGTITAELSLRELLRGTAASLGQPIELIDQKGQRVTGEPQDREGPALPVLHSAIHSRADMAAGPPRFTAASVHGAWTVAVPRSRVELAAREESLRQRYAIGGLLSLALGLALLHFVARWLRSGIDDMTVDVDDVDSVSSSVISEFAEIGGALATARAKAHRSAAELELARHDSLTGLPGRELFLHQAQAQLQRARCSDDLGIAVLYLDLDGFKAVNDTFGHARGDKLLKEVAATLRQCVRSPDAVGRTGGDEFVVCFTAPREQLSEFAVSACDRITQEVARLGSGLGCSIGWAIATFPADCKLTELIDEADAAMYLVKSARKHALRQPQPAG